IRGVLEIAETNDAVCAMRGAAIVTGHKALDPEHAGAAPRQLLQRCTSHRAQPADDDVEMGHASSPCEWTTLQRTAYPSRRGRVSAMSGTKVVAVSSTSRAARKIGVSR